MKITQLFGGLLCLMLMSASVYAQEATPESTPEATPETAPQTLTALPDVQTVTLDTETLPPLLIGLTAAPDTSTNLRLCEGIFEADSASVQAWGPSGPMRSGELVRLETLAADETNGLLTSTYFPMLCAADAIDSGEAQAIAPDGTSFPALLYVIQPDAGTGDDRLAYVIQLPLDAYVQPGLWNLTSLAMPDYVSIGVRVPDVSAPFVLRYAPDLTLQSEQDTNLVLVGGFVPDENVIGILMTSDGYVGEFTFKVDDRGYALLAPDDGETAYGLLLFVGENGSVITGPPDTLFDVDGEALSQIDVARILYDSHWSGGGIIVETTPEAEPTPDADVEATEEVDAEATEEDDEDTEPTTVPAPAAPSGVLASAEELARPRLCPNTPAPRLRVGANGRVTPGLPNNLRSQPTQNAERLLRIPAGATFSVLSGPQCGDGYTWWEVSYNGTVGWTAEGGGNEYWVEPG